MRDVIIFIKTQNSKLTTNDIILYYSKCNNLTCNGRPDIVYDCL